MINWDQENLPSWRLELEIYFSFISFQFTLSQMQTN